MKRVSNLGAVIFHVIAPAALLLIMLSSCIREPVPPPDIYTSFPEAEILGASFYTQRNNADVTGDEAGMISKNDDGTYKVRMRRRSPSNVPTAMFITGSFQYSEYYKLICEFPEDAAIADKPYRVYVCGSRNLDGNTDADYATASDLKGQAVFRTGFAEGKFEITNEGINKLAVDRRGRPYITVFLYLYFNNVTDPDDYYEFTLHFAGGANGITPESVADKAVAYRSGDSDQTARIIYERPILARYNLRRDLNAISVLEAASSLCIDIIVPDADTGKEIEFEMRNVGLYAATGGNMITRDIINAAKVAAGTSVPEQTGVVTEVPTASTPVSYYYKVKAKTAAYSDIAGGPGAGVRVIIPGPFNSTNRLTCTLNLPDKYVEE